MVWLVFADQQIKNIINTKEKKWKKLSRWNIVVVVSKKINF
jgi:hypothetical protein